MNSNPENTLWQLWRSLQAGAPQVDHMQGIPTLATSTRTQLGIVRIGLGSADSPRLLIPVQPGHEPPAEVSGEAIRVERTELIVGNQPLSFLDLQCCQQNLSRVFLDLSEEILSRMGSGMPVNDAVSNVVADFRSLLRRRFQHWTEREKIGLFGELFFLLELVRRGGTSAFPCWVGPDGARHDFAKGALAVELKTSSRSGNRDIKVSSLEQLQVPSGGELFLRHQRFELSGSAGNTFGDLISALRSAGIREDQLGSKLDQLGVSMDDLSQDELRLRLEGCELYRVDEGFPRITPDSFSGGAMPRGIRKLEYVVDLSSASRWILPEDEAEGVVANLINEEQ